MTSEQKNPRENPTPEASERLARTGRAPGNPGNSGGKKGRSGRLPDEFKRRMQALVGQRHVDAYLRKCLRGEYGPKFFFAALQYATDRGYGKAPQPVEASGPEGGPLEVTVRFVRPADNRDG